MMKGVMSTGFRIGLPGTEVNNVPWATIVVPCGIDAIRAKVTGSFGVVVAGTLNHIPGSKWIPVAGRVVTSLIVCEVRHTVEENIALRPGTTVRNRTQIT